MRNLTYFEKLSLLIGITGLILAMLAIVVPLVIAKPTSAMQTAPVEPPRFERHWVVETPASTR